MASSSADGLMHSQRGTSQNVQIDETFSNRQSRKAPKGSSTSGTSGIKSGGITRRRSTTNSRNSRSSKIRSRTATLQQRSTSNLDKNTTMNDDDDDDTHVGQAIEQLNISSTSIATDVMDVSPQHQNDQPVTPMDNNNQNERQLKKHELIKKYFTKLITGGYNCKLCEGTKNANKVHRDAAYSDSNLRCHLARQHQLNHLLYPSQRSRYQIKPQALSTQLKKQLDDALIYAIIKDSRPFGDFRKTGFQHFLKVILPDTNYKGPHRTTVKKRMATLYKSYRQVLIDELSSVSDIALTTDCWSSPSRVHFICITAHYYDKEFRYISKVISFRRFIGRSFAARLRQFIRSELKKLHITNKICSITTDNGANIKLAANTKEFGIHIPCIAHGIHLTITTGLGLWGTKKKHYAVQITTQEEKEEAGYTDIDDDDQVWEDDLESDYSNDSDSDEEATDDNSNNNINNNNNNNNNNNKDYEHSYSEESDNDVETLSPQLRQDNYVEHDNDNTLMANSTEYIYNLLQRTRKLISSIHRSSNIDTYVRDQIYSKQQESNKRSQEENTDLIVYSELVLDFRIRWNSTFKMLHRFIKLSSIINNVTFTPKNIAGIETRQVLKLSKLAFSHDDWNWLSSLECVLDRFAQSTSLLSGTSYQTLSLGKMVINGLKHFLSNQKSTEPMVNHLKSLLLQTFEEYCEQNFSAEAQEAIMIASFLNPTTYFYLNEDETFIKTAKQSIVLKSKTERFMSTSTSTSSSSSSSSNFTRSIPKVVKKPFLAIESFLSSCEAPLPSSSSTTSSTKLYTIQQEIGYYISSIDKNTEFQEYWNKNQHHLPILSRMVKHFCIMPITSIASETAFSMAGYIQRKHRSSLSATTLRYSMLLKNLELHHINLS